jgi:ABC-type antimicrobial peptide transport system permease subunit
MLCTIAWQRLFGSSGSDEKATDPVSLAAVAATLTLTAVIAGVVPARRATRLDPVAAIRGD